MATELAKAYVQIIPSAKGIKGSISSLLGGEADSAGKSAGTSVGNRLVSTFKTVVAAAGLGKALGASLTEGADLQQSIGGIETLFKDSADTVKGYAANAYKTAGLSANQYMETVTSFSASLLQSMGNDTAAAAEKANMALTDMSDNANKMGTNMQDIQNAYQGFAKQNYTMLDNLKLGYGGTKEEMERLLADAQAISGVEYDVSSYADVVDAIHVIQTEMGITGTTAKEASETFSGSMAAMKAAAKNLIGNLSLGEDIGPSLAALQETTYTFLVGNFFPMVGNILSQLPQVIGTALSAAVRAINIAADNADQIVAMGVELVTGIAEAVIGAIPYLLEAAVNLLAAFGQAILDTDWVEVATNLANNIRDALDQASGEIFGSDDSIIAALGESITNNLPAILSKGVEIITNLVNGILAAIPGLITTAGELIQQFAGFIVANLPAILDAGAQIIENLGQGIEEALPEIFSALTDTITEAVTSALEFFGILVDGSTEDMETIKTVVSTVMNSVQTIFSTVLAVVKGVVNTFLSVLKGDWSGALNSIKTTASTVWDGIKTIFSNKLSLIKTAVSTALDAIKGYFSDKLNAAKTTVTSIFDSIKTAITDKITAAKNTVTSMIDAIKSKFNFTWSLPHLKLPHLSISGSFSLTPPSVPRFSIAWYKKAMDNAMILDGATIFGMAGNTFLGGGEAGTEVVSGAKTLMDMIRQAVFDVFRPTTQSGRLDMNVVINITPAPGMSEKELADYAIDRLRIEVRKAGYQLA